MYISEIVGKSGIWCLKTALPDVKKAEKPDIVIANGNGVTGSWGLGRQHAGYVRKLGVDVITGGDCIFYKKDLVEGFDTVPYVIRPANFPPESPGRGWRLQNVGGVKIAVVSFIGRAGFNRVHGENPFTALSAIVERLRRETPYIIVDFHAAATAEKLAFFYHADGKVSAVIGSHGRVQTADERVLAGGTAVITDAGRTGSIDSVAGTDADSKIKEYLSRIPDWSKDAWQRPELQGIIIDINDEGKSTAIRRVKIDCEQPENIQEK